MRVTQLLMRATLPLALVCTGCGGGESVENQERFQVNQDVEVAISNGIRAEVANLKSAMASEGMAGLRNEAESAAENMESTDTSALSEEAQATAAQIKALTADLLAKAQAGQQKEAQELLQQMTDLADQLPQ